jgi:2-dehydropantoate 2-reductase
MYGKDARIAVIGVGAIGGVSAGFMARAGCNVEVVCKYQELAEKIKSNGLHIFGVRGDHKVSMPAVAKISELSEKKDVIFLATKATDMMAAAKNLLPFLTDSSVVVSMQNGICEDALAEIFGRERTIACVVGWGAIMHTQGELEMTSTGEFVIGNIDNKPDQRLSGIKEILCTIVPVKISENITGNLYSKLIVNSCINSLGAICGLYLGEILSIKKIRNIFLEIMREAIAVANAMDIKVEVYAGKLDYYKILKGSGFIANLKRHLLVRVIGFKYRKSKPSTLQSLERGKPTEIDYLNGYIASNGKEHNIPTPVNDKIIRIVKDIEAGEKQIALSNLDDPFFSRFG